MKRDTQRVGAAVQQLCIAVILLINACAAVAQQIDPSLYSGMRWRSIGPFRAGRVTTVSGVPGTPVFYMGTPGGGVWKTTDAGEVWFPIFDKERVASIGAMEVSRSNPNIIYVATGEQTTGNGVYKSTDSGATWRNIGLQDTHVITALLVDPHNPDIVLVGVAGDRASAAARGVYKTTDGGRTWQKTLFRDENSAVMDMSFSADAPNVIYAALWLRPSGPPQQGQRPPAGPDAWVYRSTDEGSTWQVVEAKGMPASALGRVGVAVAPGSQGQRVYAIVGQGLFRSDDGGATWQQSTTDPRILGSGYFSRVVIDPHDANVVYVAQTSLYRSTDAGKTFEPFAGAPSGDDFHILWIDPTDSNRIICGVDQGAIVSVNGGKTWSSWYNQPTGQFYHVSTDNQFPYYVYAAQQDSGSVAVASRSDQGEITFRDWFSPGAFEVSYLAPDPTNPNLIYEAGWYGTVIRFDKMTGQIAHLFVRSSKYRTSVAPPLAFSPQDPRILYMGAQSVMKTTDGGMTWQAVSPDLTKPPTTVNGRQQGGNGVILSLAPSTKRADVIWAGTSDGLIQVTQDAGRTWQNVTPKNDMPQQQASIVAVEAGRHESGTAYAVVNSFQEQRPIFLRTHDLGKTWTRITQGLPDGMIGRVVREDPARRGLLYAGTENAVWVSFDDGDHWQSLQLNLPTASVRDLDVHGDDLVAATFGRSLWILDDLTPLREANSMLATQAAHLYRPQTAVRVRWDMNQDTPLPIETPAGENPPDGAIINYFLKSAPEGDITLAIYDQAGKLVRQYSSAAQPETPWFPNAPKYWFAPLPALGKNAGMNRFAWNLRYPNPKTVPFSYFGNLLQYTEYTLADHAVPGLTPREQPEGPLAVPGQYSVVLTANGQQYRQPLVIKPDPRVRATQADLVQQLELARRITSGMETSYNAFQQVTAVKNALADQQKPTTQQEALAAVKKANDEIAALDEGTRTDPGIGPVHRDLTRLLSMVESGDSRPSGSLRAATDEACQALSRNLARWRQFSTQGLSELNAALQQHQRAPLPAPAAVSSPGCQ